jgi:hypothetical protein
VFQQLLDDHKSAISAAQYYDLAHATISFNV